MFSAKEVVHQDAVLISKKAGHPGNNQVSWAISRTFLWPFVYTDVALYVAAYSLCVQK